MSSAQHSGGKGRRTSQSQVGMRYSGEGVLTVELEILRVQRRDCRLVLRVVLSTPPGSDVPRSAMVHEVRERRAGRTGGVARSGARPEEREERKRAVW